MSERRFPRAETLALAAVLLLAAALRFFDLGGSSLWSDEGNTWALIQRSFGQITRDAAADIHPPGYYWLLKLWAIPFGTSAAALRAFSALCGVLLVAAGCPYWPRWSPR
jgi:predicted membrane-bound mannosyltransferase